LVKILMIDDDLGILDSFTQLFEMHGFSVQIAKNEDEAFAILYRKEINVIVIDYFLDLYLTISGLAVAKRIKKRYPALPIILLSAEDIRELEVGEVIYKVLYKSERYFFRNLARTISEMERDE